MEQLLSNDLSVATLLGIFIIGLFTKRFVPWWVHEEVLNKLKEYEENAPKLTAEMQKMIRLLEDPRTVERLNIVAPRAKQVDVQTRSIIRREAPRVRVRRVVVSDVPTKPPTQRRRRGK